MKKNVIISGLVVSLACSLGGYKLHKDNPYIWNEIIPTLKNESIIPDRIKDIYDTTMITYKEAFPEYSSIFDERMKGIKIYLSSINKYTQEEMGGSVFVQKNDQLLILPSRMSEDFPHEALHAMTDKESTGVCGFKKNNGKGKSVNEGFATLVHSELFLENPASIEKDTLYNVELSSARIITSMVGRNKMIKYFFEEDYSIDDVINELGNVLKDKDLSNAYIDSLDEYNEVLTEYALIYTKYKNNPEMYKEETIELSQKTIESLEKIFSLTYKVMNKYIDVNENIESNYIIWFNDQIDYMQERIPVENYDENYHEYYKKIDELSFNEQSKAYDYLGLINDDKTTYINNYKY